MFQKKNYRIANIVASTVINQQVNLNLINKTYQYAEYDPEIYFALIYKILEPKLSILVNWSGKIIFVGAKSKEEIESARKIFFKDLIKLGYKPQKTPIIIHNIIITLDIGKHLNLEKIFNENLKFICSNVSQKSSRIILKNKKPKFTALIFNSGKVNIVGIKKMRDINQSIRCIEKIIKLEYSNE